DLRAGWDCDFWIEAGEKIAFLYSLAARAANARRALCLTRRKCLRTRASAPGTCLGRGRQTRGLCWKWYREFLHHLQEPIAGPGQRLHQHRATGRPHCRERCGPHPASRPRRGSPGARLSCRCRAHGHLCLLCRWSTGPSMSRADTRSFPVVHSTAGSLFVVSSSASAKLLYLWRCQKERRWLEAISTARVSRGKLHSRPCRFCGKGLYLPLSRTLLDMNEHKGYCGGVVEGVWLPLGEGGFGAGFFLVAGFLGGGGAVSSTTVFLGGISARAACSAVRSCPISVSFADAIRSMRSAKARRESCRAPKSRLRDWNSSLPPNAPVDSTTELVTSNSASRLRYILNVSATFSGEAFSSFKIPGRAFCRLR